jgi:hypothetical protein
MPRRPKGPLSDRARQGRSTGRPEQGAFGHGRDPTSHSETFRTALGAARVTPPVGPISPKSAGAVSIVPTAGIAT